MRSIRTKILTLAFVCVLVSNIMVMIIGIVSVSETADSSSAETVKSIAQKNAQEVDTRLLLIEQSVSTLYQYIYEEIEESPYFWRNGEALDAHLEDVHRLAQLALENTDGALSVYYHMAPELTLANTGFYILQTEAGTVDYPPTDVRTETEEEWYFQPLEKEEPVWLLPYQNSELETEIISYVIPIYYGSQTVGVVGMDIDMDMLRKLLRDADVYGNGYALLMDSDGNLYYHPSYPSGLSVEEFTRLDEKESGKLLRARSSEQLTSYRWDGSPRKIIFRKLANGMSVGIVVPLSSIRKLARIATILDVVIVVIVLVVTLVLADHEATSIVKPLQELVEVGQKLASGKLDVTIESRAKDEVRVLADCLQTMAAQLREQMASANEFARTDSLTGAYNKTAYQEQVKQLDQSIENGSPRFSVAILDVNSLKHMNDTYGHEAGDLWITGAAKAMMRAFGRSRVYRIGGDEFAVLLDSSSRKHYDRMLSEFRKEVDKFNQSPKPYTESLCVACGLADYNGSIDKEYADVFARADNEMYENKKFLKGLK